MDEMLGGDRHDHLGELGLLLSLLGGRRIGFDGFGSALGADSVAEALFGSIAESMAMPDGFEELTEEVAVDGNKLHDKEAGGRLRAEAMLKATTKRLADLTKFSAKEFKKSARLFKEREAAHSKCHTEWEKTELLSVTIDREREKAMFSIWNGLTWLITELRSENCELPKETLIEKLELMFDTASDCAAMVSWHQAREYSPQAPKPVSRYEERMARKAQEAEAQEESTASTDESSQESSEQSKSEAGE